MPGAGDRILAMAEREQAIRADGQDNILANDSKRINGAVLLGIALIVVAGIAAWNAHAITAVLLGLAGVVNAVLRQIFAWLGREKQNN